MQQCCKLSSGPAIPRAYFSEGPTFSALLMCLSNIWEMKERLNAELPEKVETLLFLLLFVPSRNLHHPGNYFSPFFSWLSWDTWVRWRLPQSSQTTLSLPWKCSWSSYLTLYPLHFKSQFESHLFDSSFCLFWNWTWKYCLLGKRQLMFKDTFRIILQINLCLSVNDTVQ